MSIDTTSLDLSAILFHTGTSVPINSSYLAQETFVLDKNMSNCTHDTSLCVCVFNIPRTPRPTNLMPVENNQFFIPYKMPPSSAHLTRSTWCAEASKPALTIWYRHLRPTPILPLANFSILVRNIFPLKIAIPSPGLRSFHHEINFRHKKCKGRPILGQTDLSARHMYTAG